MSNSFFQFKQFRVEQNQCSHKVGTDGVLLGAWAEGGNRILDIGTGTGLIALMMAQRFPFANIDAIEINKESAQQAAENFRLSPWSKRIKLFHVSAQDFLPEDKYDSIVCNPPFFLNSLPNPDSGRRMARHADSLPFQTLFQQSAKWLKEEGKLHIIIPYNQIEQILSLIWLSGFYLYKNTLIKTSVKKVPKRCLCSFSKLQHSTVETREEILIGNDGKRSEWYSNLTADFYL